MTDDLTLQAIATLYLDGVRRFVTPPTTRQIASVSQMNALLSSRDLPALQVEMATRADIAAWQRLCDNESGVDSGRRGFLTRIAAPVAEVAEPEQEPVDPLVQILSVNCDATGALFPVGPRIDASRCTGCDACLRVCPTDVLILRNDDDGAIRYNVVASQCTGCALCVEVCDTDAIALVEMQEQSADIPLVGWLCPTCGVAVHEPAGREFEGGSCRICRKTGHHKKLFQVLT